MRITLNNRFIPLDGTSMQCKTNWRHRYCRLCKDSTCLQLLETESMVAVEFALALLLVVVGRAAITADADRRHRVLVTNTVHRDVVR
jgi:hypothetical protein